MDVPQEKTRLPYTKEQILQVGTNFPHLMTPTQNNAPPTSHSPPPTQNNAPLTQNNQHSLKIMPH